VINRGGPPRWSHRYDDVRPDLTDRVVIELLVRNFYREAAKDALLGPVFEAVRLDWQAHITNLVDFWASLLLGEPGYVSEPLRAQQPMPARTPLGHAHHERWVALFSETVDSWFAGPMAELAKTRARTMANAMERPPVGVDGDGDASLEPVWRLAASA